MAFGAGKTRGRLGRVEGKRQRGTVPCRHAFSFDLPTPTRNQDYFANCTKQALEGKEVKDLLSNVGSGGGAAAPASGGAAGGATAAAEETKEEAKEEGTYHHHEISDEFAAVLPCRTSRESHANPCYR